MLLAADLLKILRLIFGVTTSFWLGLMAEEEQREREEFRLGEGAEVDGGDCFGGEGAVGDVI